MPKLKIKPKFNNSEWEILLDDISIAKNGIKTDPQGYWNKKNHGKPVRIPSNQITMRGVSQPLYGEDDTGYAQIMYPNQDYQFPGNSVTEFPIMQTGGILPKAQLGTQVRQPIRGTQQQYQAYQDSLDLYNIGEKEYYNTIKTGLAGDDSDPMKVNPNTYRHIPYNQFIEDYNRGNQKFGVINSGTGDYMYPQNIDRWNSEGFFGFLDYANQARYKEPVQPIIYQPEEKKVLYSKNVGKDNPPDTYSKKYPPIYVTDANDPSIGMYTEAGNQILYKAKERPKEKPITLQPLSGIIPNNLDLGDINPIPFAQGTYFSRDRQNQERGASQFGFKGKKDYFDKKTGKLLGTYKSGGSVSSDLETMQEGGKISINEFRPKFANSNENIQQQILQQNQIDRGNKGSEANPIKLQEAEVIAPRQLDPSKKAFGTVYPSKNIRSSADLASAMFATPVMEALHLPSRAVNYGIGAYKNKDLSFNPFESEISETLGWQNNDPTDIWAGLRNFAVDNAADFVVPVEGFSNVGSKTIPKIGGAAKTGLREGVDLVHPVGRRLKQIEQEGVSQGLSTQAIKNRQMQEVGITSLQREGYFPGVSEVLSEYFVPYSYDNAKKRLLNIPKKIIKGDTNTKRLADLNKVILDQGENTLSKPRYDAWRMYSGLPQKHGTFRMAETSPINHPSYTQNQLSNLEKFSLNDERRLLTTLPNEYDNLRFMYNDDDLLNNVNYLKEQLKDINVLQKKGIDFPQSDFTTTNVMGGYNRRFFDNKMEYNDVWDLDFNGIKVDNYYGKPFMSHGQLDYSLEAPKKVINTLLNRANSLERNINPVKGKTKYDFDNIKLKNYINLQDVKTTKKKLGGKINSSDWEIL